MKNSGKDFMKVTTKTLRQDGLDAIYSGLWSSPRRRNKIFSKPRYYRFSLHILDILGVDDVITFAPKEKLDKQELSELIKHYLEEYLLGDYKPMIDINASYIVIRVDYKK